MSSAVRDNDYRATLELIKWLRAEVIRSAELAISSKDIKTFQLLRSRLLDLFGEGWGAEKKLKEIYSNQHHDGQARIDFEKCKRGDAYDS